MLFYIVVWQHGERELEADLSPAAFAVSCPGRCTALALCKRYGSALYWQGLEKETD